MEEGPEPQEWVERAAEEHHHASGHTKAGTEVQHAAHTLPAITAAVLAVLAALGSLMSGHAANQAILAMTRASDQWAYFQSKSTKGHLYEVGAEIVTALGQAPQPEGRASPRAAEAAAVEHFRKEATRYDQEKAKIEKDAEAIQEESRHELEKHHRFALAVATFQVGIVLASVSLLVRLKGLYALSLVAGAIGIVALVLGLAA
jgi:hypothetical protein